MVYFLLGRTAFFQARTDLITDLQIKFVLIPTLLATGGLLALLITGLKSSVWANLGYLALVSFVVLTSILLISWVHPDSLTVRERVVADVLLQTTEDGRYEYQMELVNIYQRNAQIRIFIRDLETGEEMRIPLDMDARQIRGFSGPSSRESWIVMEETEISGRYRVSTTRAFQSVELWVFELDMDARETELIEKADIGMMWRTDDDRYYSNTLSLITFSDGNHAIRLSMTNTETEETTVFPVEIDLNEIITLRDFRSGWRSHATYREKRSASLEVTDTPEVYILVLSELFVERERSFEVNMETGTIRELE